MKKQRQEEDICKELSANLVGRICQLLLLGEGLRVHSSEVPLSIQYRSSFIKISFKNSAIILDTPVTIKKIQVDGSLKYTLFSRRNKSLVIGYK